MAFRAFPMSLQSAIMNKTTASVIAAFVSSAAIVTFGVIGFAANNSQQVVTEDIAERQYRGPIISQEHAESIVSIIRTEGLDYAFSHYAIYRDVNDLKFHELRAKYLQAANELREYVYTKAGEEYDPKNYE